MSSSNPTNEPRRLATLPGYDTAPDIYETPDLTDSTTSATSPRSDDNESVTSVEDEEENDSNAEEDAYGVSRRRLHPARARAVFGKESRGYEAKGLDLSDRVDGRRKGLRVRRGGYEEDEEGLEARLARLRREVEECRVLKAKEGGEGEGGEVEELSRLLERFDGATPAKREGGVSKEGEKGDVDESEEVPTDDQTISKVTAFDSRLAALEQALGISTLDAATHDTLAAPVLPSLTLLDQQLSALTSASSLASLDAASTRIAKLRADASSLSTNGTTGQANGDVDDSTLSSEEPPTTTLTPDDIQKLHALYALLPTLQSLAPTVPAMLNRLRSLRALHTSAATASSELDEVEKRQVEMESDLKSWREGLEKVEAAILAANESNGKNGVVVEGWVKELESRMEGLSR